MDHIIHGIGIQETKQLRTHLPHASSTGEPYLMSPAIHKF